MNDKIMGGAFILARQIFTSSIWQDKPSTWKIIWVYIIGQVNHKDNGKFKRGEGYFNFKRELKDIGSDITYDMIRHSLRWLKDEEMISTSRSTRGMTIKVLRYDKYQTLDNYQSTTPSTSKAQEKHIESTPINKNDKNDKNDKNIASPKRRRITFDKKDYEEIITSYELLKGVSFKGSEYLPLQQTIKSMFMAGREKKDILALMETLSSSELDHWQSWTIQTVKKQLPLFLSGNLNF